MEANRAFTEILTIDGSPTLVARDGEAMHNLESALMETIHVYGPAIDRVIERGLPPRFAVVGLGLGYIEYLILAKCARAGVEPEILSYESEPEVSDSLQDCVERGAATIYRNALDAVSKATGESGLLKIAYDALYTARWRIAGDVREAGPDFSASAILYDPFSRKSTPALWEDAFLDSFLVRHAGPDCVFSTYASFSDLKRALARHGFSVEPREGFGKKRECTFASRSSGENNS